MPNGTDHIIMEIGCSDTQTLDETLDRLTRQANRVIALETLDPAQMTEEAGPLHDTVTSLTGFLERHLTDEEDVIVPLILKYGQDIYG